MRPEPDFRFRKMGDPVDAPQPTALDVERAFCSALIPEGVDVIQRVTARFSAWKTEFGRAPAGGPTP